jgi:hypothetical protein
MNLDPRLLELLVCPVTRTRLTHDPERQLLISDAAGLAFPIRDGIPHLLLDEALTWPPETGPFSPAHP